MRRNETIFLKSLRLLMIITTVVALCGAGWWYFFISVSLSPGSGPAGEAVSEDLFTKTWTERQVFLVGLGDSITDGFGATEGFSYFERLIENPDGDSEDMTCKNLSIVLPNMTTRNLSVSGSTSIHCREKQIPYLSTNSIDVLGIIVMTTGGNDIIHQYGEAPPTEGAMYGATFEQAERWIQNYKSRLDVIIKQIKSRFPGGCHIFLANIYDPTDGTGDTGNTGLPDWPDALKVLHAYNAIIAECAKKYDFVYLVNIHDPFLGHGIHSAKTSLKHYHSADPHYWYYPNIEDPNDRGYDAIRRLFLLEIAKAFQNK